MFVYIYICSYVPWVAWWETSSVVSLDVSLVAWSDVLSVPWWAASLVAWWVPVLGSVSVLEWVLAVYVVDPSGIGRDMSSIKKDKQR